jgi:LPXTG-motif cell wall-anchored protein
MWHKTPTVNTGGELPHTGATATAWIAAAAGLLLLGGTILVVIAYRRRKLTD